MICCLWNTRSDVVPCVYCLWLEANEHIRSQTGRQLSFPSMTGLNRMLWNSIYCIWTPAAWIYAQRDFPLLIAAIMWETFAARAAQLRRQSKYSVERLSTLHCQPGCPIAKCSDLSEVQEEQVSRCVFLMSHLQTNVSWCWRLHHRVGTCCTRSPEEVLDWC